MNRRVTAASLTRIGQFDLDALDVRSVAFESWATGDYVVGRVEGIPGNYARMELTNGRMSRSARGDLLMGALGVRHATLEVTGSWREIGSDMRMRALTGAGLFGKMTSKSPFCPTPLPITYAGHVHLENRKATMRQFVEHLNPVNYETTTVLLYGTSMSAGKTTVAQAVIRVLKDWGLRVVGCKMTGAGRYRDILAMSDAGADEIIDFVDVGLPSTICERTEFRKPLVQLLTRIQNFAADVVVVELGASPLEPYNGAMAIAAVRPHVCCSILCASDPYAVAGVISAFRLTPDLAAGVATNTRAGVELIEHLCGVRSVNVLDEGAREVLGDVLAARLGVAAA